MEVIALGVGFPGYRPEGRTFHHDSEPALLPYLRPARIVLLDRGQERLAPQVSGRRDALRTHTQTHKPPTAVVGLDEIGVTKRLERAVEAAMGQDGIMRAALPGSPRSVAARDRHHMTVLCPTLSDHQIVATVDPVEVGAFPRS